jgi:hypothetical protein
MIDAVNARNQAAAALQGIGNAIQDFAHVGESIWHGITSIF